MGASLPPAEQGRALSHLAVPHREQELTQAISAGQEPSMSWGGQDLLPGAENYDQGSSTEGIVFPSALPAMAFYWLASHQALGVLLQYLVC